MDIQGSPCMVSGTAGIKYYRLPEKPNTVANLGNSYAGKVAES